MHHHQNKPATPNINTNISTDWLEGAITHVKLERHYQWLHQDNKRRGRYCWLNTASWYYSDLHCYKQLVRNDWFWHMAHRASLLDQVKVTEGFQYVGSQRVHQQIHWPSEVQWVLFKNRNIQLNSQTAVVHPASLEMKIADHHNLNSCFHVLNPPHTSVFTLTYIYPTVQMV